MKTPITGIAQHFTDQELLKVLDTPEVRDHGNYGFTGDKCRSCGILANFPVSFLWTDHWTCSSCEHVNVRHNLTPWPLPYEKPDLGPSKALLNQILEELGLHGRKYS